MARSVGYARFVKGLPVKGNEKKSGGCLLLSLGKRLQ
jgi:hypothetical protein